MNFSCVEEPDLAVCIFKELSFHLKNIVAANFLDVVRHFQALLLNVSCVVSHGQQILVRRHLLVIIVPYLLIRIQFVDFSHEFANNWVSAAYLSLDAGLDDFNLIPVRVIGSLIELVLKVDVSEDLDVVSAYISHESRVLVPVRFALIFPLLDNL